MRQFAPFLALAGLCGLRKDFLNNLKALSSVGRLPGSPDLHHPGFLHRYQIRQIGGTTVSPNQIKRTEDVEIHLVGVVV